MQLLERLKELGCGRVMLRAIKAMYKCTKNVLKSATVEASIGVRQGAPSSCLLFILYIDKMVKMVKGDVGTDRFLGNLHMLLLMDGAVVVASSREMCIKKFRVIYNFCTESGMEWRSERELFLQVPVPRSMIH